MYSKKGGTGHAGEYLCGTKSREVLSRKRWVRKEGLAGRSRTGRGLAGRGGTERGRDGPEEAVGREEAVMAQQRVLPQSKETLLQSYNKRLKDDVKSIMDNFTEIIKTAKVSQGRGGSTETPDGRVWTAESCGHREAERLGLKPRDYWPRKK